MYYFRPYNADTVHQHRALVSQWDGNPANPYSVSMFEAINEDFSQRFPQILTIPTPLRRSQTRLPALESLLRLTP